MPKPRKAQISLQDTSYYHCISRCVRRSFLCGIDEYTGKSYEHRRQWVEDRLMFLSTVFSIELCAFAVMSNHTHVVLNIDHEQALSWTETQVLERWHQIYNGTELTQRFLRQDHRGNLSEAELKTVRESVKIYRQRLFDVSWFMRCLNEFIAREANKEDKCTGRFWEGRFKSQALLDEKAVLACMIYVDLNPVKAGLATSLDTSTHTSIFHRIQSQKQNTQPSDLMSFIGNTSKRKLKDLPLHFHDYLALAKASVLALKGDRQDNRHLTESTILNRFDIEPQNWSTLVTEFEQCFGSVAGSEINLRRFQQNHSLKRIPGLSSARELLRAG